MAVTVSINTKILILTLKISPTSQDESDLIPDKVFNMSGIHIQDKNKILCS